jgi:hypothetical protein
MRERAKAENKYLYTFSVTRPDGTHEITSQGPATKDELTLMSDAWLKMLKMKETASDLVP